MPYALVYMNPTMADVQNQLGEQMAQAFGAFGGPQGRPIPVNIKENAEPLRVEGAVRSAVDENVLRFYDLNDRELAIVPLFRVNYVMYKD